MDTMGTNATWWWCGCLLAMVVLPVKGFATKQEDIFEKPTEGKIGPNSTFFITPKELKYNHNQYNPIDTSVTKMDYFTVVERHNYMLQNLGNNWTAAQYIPYIFPKRIGATDGLFVYDFNFRQPQDIRYYCMPKSKAYAHFNIVLAHLGSFVFDGCYSQRLLDNWFAGVNIYGAMTENEWPHTKKAEKIVDAFPQFDIFTHFHLLDAAYYACTSYSIMDYCTQETGGIAITSSPKVALKNGLSSSVERCRDFRKLLDERFIEARIPLRESGNGPKSGIYHSDKRRHFYFYHQYFFTAGMQWYHDFFYSCKNHTSNINIREQDTDVVVPLDGTTTKLPPIESKVRLAILSNEMGIKGNIASMRMGYNLHARIESIQFTHDYSEKSKNDCIILTDGQRKKKEKEIECYLGCHAQWNLTQHASHQLHLDAEYLWQKAGFYTLTLAYQNRFGKLAYNTIKHKVPYLVQHGYFPYRPWTKPYSQPFSQQLAVSLMGSILPWVRIEPMLTLQRIQHHIYYSDSPLKKNGNDYDHRISIPMQATDPIDLCTWGGHVDLSFSYFHIDNTVIFLNDISNTKVKIYKGHMPPYSYTGRFYFAHQPYKKKMAIEIGINLHVKASYYADGYDIVAQRFYQQKYFPVQGKPIVDLFGNYRVGNLKISIKYSCINDHFGKKKFYFSTPFYPGQRPAADVGVHWSFFD